MDQGVVKIQKLCPSLLGSEIWQPPWGRICGQNPAWGADPFPQGDLTLWQLAVFLCEMGVPGSPWKSSRPPHSFFSPPPPSTPCSTDPSTPTSIKPLPHIPSVHTGPHSVPCKHPTPPRRHTRQPEAFRLTPSSSLPLSLRRPPYATLTTPISSSHIVSVFPRGFPSPHPSSPHLAPRAWEGWYCILVPHMCQLELSQARE